MAGSKAKRAKFNIMPTLVVIALLGVIWVVGSQAAKDFFMIKPPRVAITQNLECRVGGDATSATVTIGKPDGGIEQLDVRPPWSRIFTASSGEVVSISAQNAREWGEITVTVLADGVTAKSARSNADYGIASTHYRVP